MVLFLLLLSLGHAAYTIDILESGGSVTVAGSGTLTFGRTPNSSGGLATGPTMTPSTGVLRNHPSGNVDRYFGEVAGPSSWGSGASVNGASSSGDSLFLDQGTGNLYVTAGYIDGSSLTFLQAYTGSFASLGLTPGAYQYTLDSGDTLAVCIGAGACDEPVDPIITE